MKRDPRNRVLARREVLLMGAAGAAGAVGLFGMSSLTRALGECNPTAPQTEGPFWVDEMLNRSDIRSDPATGDLQEGVPLRLSINVSEIQGGSCAPVAGAYVDIWQCNALGVYSNVTGFGGDPDTVGQRWLRGYQTTDAHGNARFLTIYPGWYIGRTGHIHLRVRKFSGETTTLNFVSQMYFDDAISDALYASASPYSSRAGRFPASNAEDFFYDPALLSRVSHNGDHALASFDVVTGEEVAMNDRRLTPTDEHSLEHMHDFGGGSPPSAIA